MSALYISIGSYTKTLSRIKEMFSIKHQYVVEVSEFICFDLAIPMLLSTHLVLLAVNLGLNFHILDCATVLN